MKYRALDLFCCAGGATRGLQLAGFHVTGIDNRKQPRYVGDAFIQADALRPPVDLQAFDFIWASPPCQAFTALRHMWNAREHPNHIPAVREMVARSGVPYCIENVEGAPLNGSITMLCGTMFGLVTPDDRYELRRHRLFETSFCLGLVPPCAHNSRPVISIHGDKARDRRRSSSFSVVGTGAPVDAAKDASGRRRSLPLGHAQAAMGIDWCGMRGLSQAIPPAYSEFIGKQVCRVLEEAA